MLTNLVRLFENGENARAVLAIFSILMILGLMVWIAVIDIKKQKIVFWKLLITGGAVIILPALVSLTTGVLSNTLWLLLAVPVWFLLLYLNIKYNKQRLIGKADIDIITAPFSLLIVYSIFLMREYEAELAATHVTSVLFEAFKYLLIGSVVYLILYIVLVICKVAGKKESSFKTYMKTHKISMIPMLVPFTVYAAYLVMTEI